MTISGVIEGFYGPPWTHDDRLAWIDRLCTWGMTHYVWAAKQEPRHRDDWAAPFTDDELVGFGELARRTEHGGVPSMAHLRSRFGGGAGAGWVARS